ncbi:uncharacterized protein LOC130448847 [Diorhabda sublineata]|uniref:uncharacterized protein LOC130448847 n=1 Tax=Diorhabda sublineata TaxID=1163346 RepID=UPI0024E17939|nr:uncharacterized protein LOC130448847 [Diorhabda sublineata]
MSKFQALFAAVLIQLQIHSTLSGTLSDDVKLADLSNQFSFVLEKQLQNIDKTGQTLETLVEEYKKSLELELQQLRQYIEETTVQAVQENKDISNCLNERLGTISFKQIDLCDQRNLVEYCRNVLIHLTKEYYTILSDINQCNSSVTVDSCRYTKICKLRNAIKNADILITSLLNIAHDSAFQCTKISVMKIDHNITSLAKSFTTCSDVIMEFV